MTTHRVLQSFLDAWRSLRRAPAFVFAAGSMLALGIAGTTLLFTLVDGILLRPLAAPDEDALLVAWKQLPATGFDQHPFITPELESIARESRLLRQVAGVGFGAASPWAVREAGADITLDVALVSGEFFNVLGVAPVLGRTLTSDDDREGALPVMVISHAYWQRHYGGAADVLDRHVSEKDRTYAVVGVMPDVDYPRGVEAWRTLASLPADAPFAAYARRNVALLARMHRGVTIDQAAAELQAIIARLEAVAPAGVPRGLTPVVRTLRDDIVGDVRAPILMLFASAGLLLLIGCANVAGLIRVRGAARRTEFAVRSALGAGRGRLTAVVMAESLLLAIGAGALGVLVAWWCLPTLVAWVPDGLPQTASLEVDGRVVAFAMAVAACSAVLAAIGPARAAARIDLTTALRAGGRGSSGVDRRRLRPLVVAQAALAVLVVAGAGLLIRSVERLNAVDAGLATHERFFVRLTVPNETSSDRTRHLALLDEVVAALEALPVVTSATPVNGAPFSGVGWEVPRFAVEGQDETQAASNPWLSLEAVHPGYFTTLGATLLRGRDFANTDTDGAPAVVVISEDVAALAWPGIDPLGKRLRMGEPDSDEPWRTVVGVVRPVRYRDLRTPHPTMYVPAEQLIVTAQSLVVRSALPLSDVTALVRNRVAQVDSSVRVRDVVPLDSLRAGPLARPRFHAQLVTGFGITALLIAAMGTYAMAAAGVRQRRMEFGVRLALGATPPRVRAMVLWEGLRLSALGAGAGLVGAGAAATALRTLLFDVHPFDPVALAGATIVLLVVSALACHVPARRAAHTDPATLLRTE